MTQAEQHDATQAPAETTTTAAPIRAYKAFDQNMQCRGFQFKVGQTYEHDGPVKACESGFHACENPLDVWSYYPLDSRYAVVELGGDVSRHDSDSKIAAARITISAEIALPQIISDGVAYLMELCKDAFALKPEAEASGYGSQLAASGDCSQLAASGDCSKLAASGDCSQLAASGYDSQLAASGDCSKLAASGYDSKLAASGPDSKLAASGDCSKLAASGYGSKLAASGYDSQLAASGYGSKLAASGDCSKLAASGENCVCVAASLGSTAQAGAGGAIALTYSDGERYRIAVAYVGEDGIEPNVDYRVTDAGEFVKAQG
ncbi:hypothetical protein [Thauera sp.]|uniref:DUF7666 domain-containing protein n=1 Tax=Thauera sp. TaxID=1905334 RepID=UPI0026331B94|nr:hypothetical protein [Thauera sp.]